MAYDNQYAANAATLNQSYPDDPVQRKMQGQYAQARTQSAGVYAADDAQQSKTPVSQILLKDAAGRFDAIGHAMTRIETAADRLVGSQPEADCAEEKFHNPGHHAGVLSGLVGGLHSLERRLRIAADRLESFV